MAIHHHHHHKTKIHTWFRGFSWAGPSGPSLRVGYGRNLNSFPPLSPYVNGQLGLAHIAECIRVIIFSKLRLESPINGSCPLDDEERFG